MKKQTLKAILGGFMVSLILLTEPLAVTASSSGGPKFLPTYASEQLQGSFSPLSLQNWFDVSQSAYGGGTAVEFERRSTFSFNALRHSDGSVTGTLVYIFRDFGADSKVHLKLDCLVIEGNRAKLSGLITQISANFPLPPFLSIGSRGSFQVEDNGDENAELPDKYSDLHFFEATCDDENEPYIPIDGNIVVVP